MPNYQGIWKLSEQYQAASGWPLPPLTGDIGLFAGGTTGTALNTISYVTITSTGNTTDFGDLSETTFGLAACSSSTRGLFCSGRRPSTTPANTIEFVTISSLGNAADFGDAGTALRNLGALSNETRGVLGGGANSSSVAVNIIEFVTIASAGNASDFGDMTSARQLVASANSSTRGLFAGGNSPSNVIEYITIASAGNATDFGDLTAARQGLSVGVISSSTRGVFAGGDTNGSGRLNTMDYITIASAGNAVDFGDLSTTKELPLSCSSDVRGLIAGGTNVASNAIQYITIASTGNSVSFGELTYGDVRIGAGLSNAHGGLA